MGKPKEPRLAKLFASLLFSDEIVLRQGIDDLRGIFGEIDWISEKLRFDFTDYYAEEMGGGLFRHFVTFRDLVAMDRLPDIKHDTNRLERAHAMPGGERQLNIDPGYVCMEHVLLATTKAYSHRPYLRSGIYGDLTLIYRKKSFQALEWTYPDYRGEEVIRFFNDIRKRWIDDWKGGKAVHDKVDDGIRQGGG
jgi:uncharacterized protein DUF4416